MSDRAQKLFDAAFSRREQMEQQFQNFHLRYPEVYRLFHHFTMETINTGYQHFSAMAVIQRVRWESPVGADGQAEWKINNNFAAFYSRMWTANNPEHAEFFRTRRQVSEFKPAVKAPELTPEDFPYE